MPVQFPVRTISPAQRPASGAVDVWAASVGAAAMTLGLFVYLAAADAPGAAMVLLASAGIVATVVHLVRRQDAHS